MKENCKQSEWLLQELAETGGSKRKGQTSATANVVFLICNLDEKERDKPHNPTVIAMGI